MARTKPFVWHPELRSALFAMSQTQKSRGCQFIRILRSLSFDQVQPYLQITRDLLDEHEALDLAPGALGRFRDHAERAPVLAHPGGDDLLRRRARECVRALLEAGSQIVRELERERRSTKSGSDSGLKRMTLLRMTLDGGFGKVRPAEWLRLGARVRAGVS